MMKLLTGMSQRVGTAITVYQYLEKHLGSNKYPFHHFQFRHINCIDQCRLKSFSLTNCQTLSEKKAICLECNLLKLYPLEKKDHWKKRMKIVR